VLRALFRPLAIVVFAVAALRFVIDRLPLSNSALAFVGTFVAGCVTILVVSGCLLTSDWPEAAVLQRRLRGVRRRAGTGMPR
jgi:uncharacterized membrane protein YhaH (DUF805 family)